MVFGLRFWWDKVIDEGLLEPIELETPGTQGCDFILATRCVREDGNHPGAFGPGGGVPFGNRKKQAVRPE